MYINRIVVFWKKGNILFCRFYSPSGSKLFECLIDTRSKLHLRSLRNLIRFVYGRVWHPKNIRRFTARTVNLKENVVKGLARFHRIDVETLKKAFIMGKSKPMLANVYFNM